MSTPEIGAAMGIGNPATVRKLISRAMQTLDEALEASGLI
jgi:DNA-directed RNA polymerase specialized sigma24 family protein